MVLSAAVIDPTSSERYLNVTALSFFALEKDWTGRGFKYCERGGSGNCDLLQEERNRLTTWAK